MSTHTDALRGIRSFGPGHFEHLEGLIAERDELLEALKGMIQLDEEEHQRSPGDIDICKEVQDAYAAIAKAVQS